MKLKHKISLLVIGILLVVSLLISSSYALWVFNVSQESTNVVVTDCFELSFGNEKNAIKLEYAFPMEDSVGVQLTPFEYTVTNTCSHAADLQVNLETLSGSTLVVSNLKTDLNGKVSAVSSLESVTPTLDNAISAVKIDEYTLEANSSKKFYLRLWVKDDANQSEVENATYTSKVSVVGVVRKKFEVASLISGPEFNVALKTLAGDENPTAFTNNSTVTSIQRSLVAPSEDDNAVLVSDINSSNPVYAWYKNGIIYIYSNVDKIYMNEDSSNAFFGFLKLTSLDLSYFDTSKVTSMYWMLKNLYVLENLDVSHFDTSNVTNMEDLFSGDKSLLSLDVSHFDTSKVTTMRGLFYLLKKVTSLDLSHFNTSNVTSMRGMFSYMEILTSLDVSSFDTSNVVDMFSMFAYTRALTSLDLSNFNTSKVSNMGNMFAGATNLTVLNVSSFDTHQVLDMGSMFLCTYALSSLDLSNFDTSNVINTASMFEQMTSLTTLDIRSFNTSSVRTMGAMFKNSTNLSVILVGSGWSTSSLKNKEDESSDALCGSRGMFSGLTSIVGGAGTTYDSNHTDKEYARVDGGSSNPGYLTLKSS